MMYFGGKQRISKDIAEFINSTLKDQQTFVDLFCGSCNVISKVDHNRLRVANDVHTPLVEMWKYVKGGGELPEKISQEDYYHIKADAPEWLQGFVGFGCSYSGKWWGGYARGGEGRNYCMNAKNSTLKKVATMRDVKFTNESYDELELPSNSFIYCDIPYKDTTQYSTGSFNHNNFYEWAIHAVNAGHSVYVSEYEENVPDGWRVVWNKSSKKDIRDSQGLQKKTSEVIMTPPNMRGNTP